MSRLDRRAVLQSIAAIPALGSALGPAVCLTAPGDAVDQAPAALKHTHTVLRIATPAPDRASGIADDAHHFCRLAERLSQGRIRFVGTATRDDPIKLLQAGDVDAVFGYEHAKVHLHPAFAYFAGLPGAQGLGVAETHAWLEHGAQDLWDGLSAEFGIRSFLIGHTASPATLWSAEPVTSLSQMSDQALAVPGLGAEVVKGIGGIPHAQTDASLRQALDGEVRAAEAASVCDIFSHYSMERKTFVSRSPFSKHGSSISLTLAPHCLNNTCADILMTAIAQARMLSVSTMDERRSNELLLERMAIERLAKPYALSAEVESTIQRVTDAVLADIAGFDGHARKISHSIEKLRAGAFRLGQRLAIS